MDELNPEIARLLAAKEERRERLSRLPYPEKVRAVIKLQEMAAPLLRARGQTVRVWQIDREKDESLEDSDAIRSQKSDVRG